MAILGFIFSVGLALYCTLVCFGLLRAIIAFGVVHKSDAATLLVLLCVTAGLWEFVCSNAPFTITLK